MILTNIDENIGKFPTLSFFYEMTPMTYYYTSVCNSFKIHFNVYCNKLFEIINL